METTLFPKIASKIMILIFVVSLTSCRFGFEDPYPMSSSLEIVEENIPLRNFDRVDFANAHNIFIRKGAQFSIVVKGYRFDVRDLEAIVIQDKLKIRYKNFTKNRFDMDIFITMPNFEAGYFSGASYVEINNFVEPEILLDLSGASDVFIDSDAKNWIVNLSGSSDLEILGNGKNMIFDASGASTLRASKLYLQNIDLYMTGASSAYLFASNELIGNASGASMIYFRGNPLVDIDLSGSSRVVRN